MQHFLNLRLEPHGHGSFLPNLSDSSLSPCTTRKAAFYVGFRREPFATFAAGFVERIGSSRQSLLPDGFARHITEASCIGDYRAEADLLQLLHRLGVSHGGGGVLGIQRECLLIEAGGCLVIAVRSRAVAGECELVRLGLLGEALVAR